MAGALSIKSGTKLKLAEDMPFGKEPDFNMVCTFVRSVDESAFLISIPLKGGKELPLDENRKLLIQYAGQNSDGMIVAGYVDDIVKEGIRRYWKIRRVSEHRQFFQRADERLKVSLPFRYRQATWEPGEDGTISQEEGMSLDISAGGMAAYLNRRFEVGETCELTLPNIGTAMEGRGVEDIISSVCWVREAPKGSMYRNVCGFQFRFADGPEKKQVQTYVEHVKKKYKL